MRSSFILSLLAVVAPALGVPTLVPITKRAGPFKENSYIVKLKDASPKPAFLDALSKLFGESSSQSSLTYDYGEIFHGVAVQLSGADVLRSMQLMKDVEYIEQDGIMSISYEIGLDGLSSTGEPGDAEVAQRQTKRTDPPKGNQGEGVVVYGIDTGVYVEHTCFGGRAKWGATFGGYADKDGNGHGTHTAGTAVGAKFGLATLAELFAVKVLSDQGSGATSDIMKGIAWASNHSESHRKPSVVNMSLGGLLSQSLNNAVSASIKKGLHYTIAAGNDNLPAALFSPASVPEANTIGAVDDKDVKASFSNYGSVVDVWALGVNVKSAWITGSESTEVLSGTSMAAPHVAGILAVAISKYGNKTPAELSSDLNSHAKPVGVLIKRLIAQEW